MFDGIDPLVLMSGSKNKRQQQRLALAILVMSLLGDDDDEGGLSGADTIDDIPEMRVVDRFAPNP